MKSWNKSDDASSLVGKTRPKHGHTEKCLHNTPLVFHCTTLTPLYYSATDLLHTPCSDFIKRTCSWRQYLKTILCPFNSLLCCVWYFFKLNYFLCLSVLPQLARYKTRSESREHWERTAYSTLFSSINFPCLNHHKATAARGKKTKQRNCVRSGIYLLIQ